MGNLFICVRKNRDRFDLIRDKGSNSGKSGDQGPHVPRPSRCHRVWIFIYFLFGNEGSSPHYSLKPRGVEPINRKVSHRS